MSLLDNLTTDFAETPLGKSYVKMARIAKAANGKPLTPRQEADFGDAVAGFTDEWRDVTMPQTAAIKSFLDATGHDDPDTFDPDAAVKAAEAYLSLPRARKTRDGFGPIRETHRQTSNERGEGTGAPAGRKSVNAESWGDLVWDAGSPDGQKALVPTGSTAVPLTLQPEPVTEQQRVTFLRQLIPTEETTTGAFSYLRQTTRTNNAAVVAEGARKPTSVYAMKREDDRVDTIAHLSEPIPRQYLEDAPLLRQFVDSELRYGLDLALDSEILDTILNDASAATNGGGDLTSTRKAITQLQQADFDPTGIVMSPADWETIELEAASTFAANPTFNPANAMTRRLYGIPVVVSNGMSDGTALIGDFSGATLYMRQTARVDWSEATFDPTFDSNVGATDFERNLIRFRAEMRAKLAVGRPTAFLILSAGS